MPKRKAASQDTAGPDDGLLSLRRSTRQSRRQAPQDQSEAVVAVSSAAETSSSSKVTQEGIRKKKKETKESLPLSPSPSSPPQSSKKKKEKKKTSKGTKELENPAENKEGKEEDKERKGSLKKAAGKVSRDSKKPDGEGQEQEQEKSYWLMKAEPESRFENGVDVKFSIDDLASRTEPEPWDGIRAYAARNNLRAMRQGELAFFYHSNCKEPGLVGTMEIVQEHSPDLSAHDPKAPYYDAKSKPDDPKWSVVHVKFRSKFAQPIGLKALREMGGPGQPLENMQMLKQSRLSVSRVSPAEWEYLMSVVEARGGETVEDR
ncbi:DUF55-domain-containing protein [Xylariomycetidae sp. FL2044]|nr:DUF55-domain-containing protein [Xylariomycetidae sp. FL2044]